MENLAVKYRPSTFEDVIGQDVAARILKNSLSQNMAKPAYLLSGAYGSGKTTLARIFSKALLCPNTVKHSACGTCLSCTSFEDKNNANYVEVDAASSGLVNDVRELLSRLSFSPMGSRCRVVVFDEAHQISREGQTALLKEIEEGSTGTTFIFCTTEADKILGTIHSRCIRLGLALIPEKLIYGRIVQIADKEGFSYEEEALKVVARLAGGHMRNALMSLDQLSLMGSISVSLVTQYYNLDIQDLYTKILKSLDKVEDLEKYVEAAIQRVPIREVYVGMAHWALESYLGRGSRELHAMYGQKLLAITKELNKMVPHRPSQTLLLCDLLLLESWISDKPEYRRLSLSSAPVVKSENSAPALPQRAKPKKIETYKDQKTLVSFEALTEMVSNDLCPEIVKPRVAPTAAKVKSG